MSETPQENATKELRENQVKPVDLQKQQHAESTMKSALDDLGGQLNEIRDDSRSAIAVLAGRLSSLEKTPESDTPDQQTVAIASPMEDLYQNFMDRRMQLLEGNLSTVARKTDVEPHLERIDRKLEKIDDQVSLGSFDTNASDDGLSRLENHLRRMSSNIEDSLSNSKNVFDTAGEKLGHVYSALDNKANDLRPALQALIGIRGRLDKIEASDVIDPEQQNVITKLRADILTIGGPLQEETKHLREISTLLNALSEELKTARSNFNDRDIQGLNKSLAALSDKLENDARKTEQDIATGSNQQVIDRLLDELADIKMVVTQLAPLSESAETIEEVKEAIYQLSRLYNRSGDSHGLTGQNVQLLDAQIQKLTTDIVDRTDVAGHMSIIKSSVQGISSRQDRTEQALSSLNDSVETAKAVAQNTQEIVTTQLGSLTDTVQDILERLKTPPGSFGIPQEESIPEVTKALEPLQSSQETELDIEDLIEKARSEALSDLTNEGRFTEEPPQPSSSFDDFAVEPINTSTAREEPEFVPEDEISTGDSNDVVQTKTAPEHVSTQWARDSLGELIAEAPELSAQQTIEYSNKNEGFNPDTTNLSLQSIDLDVDPTPQHIEMGYVPENIDLNMQSVGATLEPIPGTMEPSEEASEIDIEDLLADPEIAQAARLEPMTFGSSDIHPALDPNRSARPHSSDYNGIVPAQNNTNNFNEENNFPTEAQSDMIQYDRNLDASSLGEFNRPDASLEPIFRDPLEPQQFAHSDLEQTSEPYPTSNDTRQPEPLHQAYDSRSFEAEEPLPVDPPKQTGPRVDFAENRPLNSQPLQQAHPQSESRTGPISWDSLEEETHRPLEPGLGFNPTHLKDGPAPAKPAYENNDTREVAAGNAALLAKARQNLIQSDGDKANARGSRKNHMPSKRAMGVSAFVIAGALGFMALNSGGTSFTNSNQQASLDQADKIVTGAIDQGSIDVSTNSNVKTFSLPKPNDVMVTKSEMPPELDETRVIAFGQTKSNENIIDVDSNLPSGFVDSEQFNVGTGDKVEPSLLGSITDSASNWSTESITGLTRPKTAANGGTLTFQDALEIPNDIAPLEIRQVASLGDPGAIFHVAEKFKSSGDLISAFKWMKRAADIGVAAGQHKLGEYFEKGTGVEKDPKRARDYYAMAAAQGHVGAMHDLGYLSFLGLGGPKDLNEAQKLFTAASDYGLLDSQFNLAVMQRDGIGMPRNPVMAYKWFSVAALQGDRDAERLRKELQATMSQNELANARLLTQNWQPREKNPQVNLPPNLRVQTADIRLKNQNTLVDPIITGAVSTQTAEMEKQIAKLNMQMAIKDKPASQQVAVSNTFSHAVKSAQSMLNTLGFSAGNPDGYMGPNTANAIREFQAAYELSVTGKVDRDLIEELKLRAEG